MDEHYRRRQDSLASRSFKALQQQAPHELRVKGFVSLRPLDDAAYELPSGRVDRQRRNSTRHHVLGVGNRCHLLALEREQHDPREPFSLRKLAILANSRSVSSSSVSTSPLSISAVTLPT